MTIEKTNLHCPKCGTPLKTKVLVYTEGLTYGYESKCGGCDTTVTIEDSLCASRNSYNNTGMKK